MNARICNQVLGKMIFNLKSQSKCGKVKAVSLWCCRFGVRECFGGDESFWMEGEPSLFEC